MKNGFSFVETIVVVAMMGLMFVGGSAVFTTFTNRREVDEATSKVVSLLELARSNAKSRILPSGQTNLNTFRYVEVSLASNILSVRSNHSSDNLYTTVDVANVNINPSSLSACGLCFSAGESKLVLTDGNPRPYTDVVSLEITSQKDSGLNRTINIDSSGVIRRQ